jgi:hypothetical protein
MQMNEYIYMSEKQFFENGETDVAKVCSFPSFTFHGITKLTAVDDNAQQNRQ